MATVWITQEIPKFSYSAASEYGRIRFVTKKDFVVAEDSIINREISDEIATELKEFDHDNDYLAPAGSPIVAMVVAAVLGRGGRTLRMLKWDNRDYKYVPMTVEV